MHAKGLNVSSKMFIWSGRRVDTCPQVHSPVPRAFPYTKLTFVICDTAPQRDHFFSCRADSCLLRELTHGNAKHPVVKYRCYLCLIISVALKNLEDIKDRIFL